MKKSFLKENMSHWLSVAMFFVSAIFICFFLVFNFQFTNLFQPLSAAPRADAIAVRILENPHHYHPDRWYRKQGYQGQLQKLQIDGYRAVRSGRTTYVNVGNIESGELHTYIYLLSYSQDVEPATRRIYNRMIENWRLNTNLNTDGQCAISDLTCTQDQDCPGNYTCQTSGPQENKCLPPDPPACRADRNCPNHLYCDSQKSQVTRDTLRLGDLAEISILLDRYKKNHNGKYPHLR